jgi:hypothetical protein
MILIILLLFYYLHIIHSDIKEVKEILKKEK